MENEIFLCYNANVHGYSVSVHIKKLSTANELLLCLPGSLIISRILKFIDKVEYYFEYIMQLLIKFLNEWRNAMKEILGGIEALVGGSISSHD